MLAHRLVDMKVREEEARASCLLATLSLDGPAGNRARAVSGAKAKIGRNARFVAQNAIQTHGAIGTTDELALGAYAKRLMAYEMLFGSTREHLRRYAAMIADPALASAGLLLEPDRRGRMRNHMDLELAPGRPEIPRRSARISRATPCTPDMKRAQALTTGFASDPEVVDRFSPRARKKGLVGASHGRRNLAAPAGRRCRPIFSTPNARAPARRSTTARASAWSAR